MFNLEKFHNELALRLGYERIMKDKRISISIEESDDPLVTLKVQGHDDIKFKASSSDEVVFDTLLQTDGINPYFDAVHQAYVQASKCTLALLNQTE